MLSPVGNFGKFLTVMLSLSVTANIACTLYSICFNFQVLIPKFAAVPRYVFSVVGTAMYVPRSLSRDLPADVYPCHPAALSIVHYHWPSSGPTGSTQRSRISLVSSATGRAHMVPFSSLNTSISGKATLIAMIRPIGMLPGASRGE